jgi:hypothetical protein
MRRSHSSDNSCLVVIFVGFLVWYLVADIVWPRFRAAFLPNSDDQAASLCTADLPMDSSLPFVPGKLYTWPPQQVMLDQMREQGYRNPRGFGGNTLDTVARALPPEMTTSEIDSATHVVCTMFVAQSPVTCPRQYLGRGVLRDTPEGIEISFIDIAHSTIVAKRTIQGPTCPRSFTWGTHEPSDPTFGPVLAPSWWDMARVIESIYRR